MRRFRRRTADRSGFTLMELLIVLAILVLLVSLVAPQLFKASARSKVDNTKTQIGFLEDALEMYRHHVNTYPGTDQGLEALVSQPSASEETGSSVSNWDGPYIAELPEDAWGNDFQYEYPPTRGRRDKPDIWSFGPDGKDGGDGGDHDDDITNWKGDGREGGEDGEGGDEFGDFEDDNTMDFDAATGDEGDSGFGAMGGFDDPGGGFDDPSGRDSSRR